MPSISGVQVFGERNSGTNYVRKLIKENISELDILGGNKGFGWKHGDLGKPWCFYKNPSTKFCHDIKDYKNESDEALFVVVYRNPFIWLRSMHKQPHHAPTVYKKPFSEFLECKWESYYGWEGVDLSNNEKERLKIVKKDNLFEEFDNVIDLRNKKTRLFEEFKYRVKNVVYVNYELVASNPSKFLSKITTVYGLDGNKGGYKNISEDKFGFGDYKPKKYPLYSQSDMKVVLKYLDKIQEKSIGYTIPQKARSDSVVGLFRKKIDAADLVETSFRVRCYVDGVEINNE